MMTRSLFAFAGMMTLIWTMCACSGNEQKTAGAPETDPEVLAIDKLRRQTDSVRKAHQIPGLSMAIVRDTGLYWSHAVGYADIEQKRLATPQTAYHIGGLGMAFSSVLMLHAVEESKVELDRPISYYMKNYRNFCDAHKEIFYRFDYFYDQYEISLAQHFTHTACGIPGKEFQYNTGIYDFLTYVIEGLHNEPHFHRIIEQQFIDKLRMPHTAAIEVISKTSAFKEWIATPYRQRITFDTLSDNALTGQPEMTQLAVAPATASAGIASTVSDLAKLDVALNHHTLLNPQMTELMFTPRQLADGSTLPYGMGWFVQDYEGHRIVWQFSQTEGYSGMWIRIPEKNLALILLSNSNAVTQPYNLRNGDLTQSPYARAFLDYFMSTLTPES